MLENLDKIDWSNLGHAYGPAEDVPGLLRDLASPVEEERADAMGELYGNIWHQGTVYQATAYAVPFLLELLESPKVDGKDDILVLLAHLARGTSYHDVHQHLSHHKEEAKGQGWQDKVQKELGWVGDVKAAVKAGENLYLGLLNDTDARMRDAAAYVIASLDRPLAKLAEAVWKRLEREKEECVQVSLVMAFGNLAEHAEANTGSLLAMLLSSPSKSVKLAAAMSLIELSPAEQSQESIAIVVEAVRSQEGFEGFDESVWGRVDGVELLVLNHVIQLEGNAARVTESALISAMATHPVAEAVRMAEMLLRIAFRGSRQRDKIFSQLSEQQQRIVKLIAENQNLWTETVGKGSRSAFRISAELRSCGLPDQRDRLRAFVSGVAMPPPLTLEQKRSSFGDRLKKFFGR